METIKIKLEGGIMPTKSSGHAAAYDLYVPDNTELEYGRQVIDLKFSIELPHGYAAIIQPRSGFSLMGMAVYKIVRKVLFMLVGCFGRDGRVDADVIVGLVDEDYRGSVGVLVNSKYKSYFRKAVIPRGTRIAQMRIVRVPDTEFVKAEELDMEKDRGGGFGHTGIK